MDGDSHWDHIYHEVPGDLKGPVAPGYCFQVHLVDLPDLELLVSPDLADPSLLSDLCTLERNTRQ